MAFSGIEVHSVEDRKKEKSSRFLSGLKGKKDRVPVQSQTVERHSELIDTVRVQMQISEAMDTWTRRKLMQLAISRKSGPINIPQISLELLNGAFKSDFPNEKSYTQWIIRQAKILEEILCFSADHVASEHQNIKGSLLKIRNAKDYSSRAQILSAIGQVASKLSCVPGKFGIAGETYYWTAVYHLNIRIYEKLLFGLFDTLEEGQLIEDVDNVLELIKLTWSTLGITQKIHNAIYGWVLFQQFVETGEATLLDYVILELQKSISAEDDDEKEGFYLRSLLCSSLCNELEMKLSLVQAILFSLSIWCDSKLKDYHLHFSQKSDFGRVLNLLSAVGVVTSCNSSDFKLTRLNAVNGDAARKIITYVEGSIKATYERVASKIDIESKRQRMHPLALLANELRLIAKREFDVFFPIISRWSPESGMVVAMLLFRLYGEGLKPFLNEVSCLSEDVISVLSAAYLLDRELTQLFTCACKETRIDPLIMEDLDHYPIGEIAKPIIVDWVIAQHARMLEWTGRAFDLEEWEPLSSQQRQAASIIEVFRIIEETVDQFFGLNLPMDITHLQALLSVIFHSLDAYLVKLLDQLVDKNHLYPAIPPLTRFKETVMPVTKKNLPECILDKNVSNKLNALTISQLCIRLNTLQYIHKQIGSLEDGIRKSWAHVGQYLGHKWVQEESRETLDDDTIGRSEEVDELFVTTFDIIRDTTTNAISKICDFTGTRVVFWDLRDTFLFGLYRGNVKGARLDSVLPNIDTALNQVCGLIDDSLRDIVVLSICKTLLEGFVWVLLDGGPSRSFSDDDIVSMEDDLSTLKEFFIADGEGLPRSSVDKAAKFPEQILSLYSLQTETVIQMLMNASEQISTELDPHKNGHYRLEDAQTLIRILCHKKDREACKFLERQYHLPASSEYEDSPLKDSSSRSPLVSDLFQRTTSLRWSNSSYSTSFTSLKKRFQEALGP